jgi:hypothetical protein
MDSLPLGPVPGNRLRVEGQEFHVGIHKPGVATILDTAPDSVRLCHAGRHVLSSSEPNADFLWLLFVGDAPRLMTIGVTKLQQSFVPDTITFSAYDAKNVKTAGKVVLSQQQQCARITVYNTKSVFLGAESPWGRVAIEHIHWQV